MTEATLDEFIALWEKEFGEKIARGDAEVRAKQLVMMFEALLTTMNEQEIELRADSDPR